MSSNLSVRGSNNRKITAPGTFVNRQVIHGSSVLQSVPAKLGAVALIGCTAGAHRGGGSEQDRYSGDYYSADIKTGYRHKK